MIVVLRFIMLLIAIPAMANDWEPVVEQDKLIVRRRAYAGSALNEIQGITRIRASLNSLMALLRDAPFNRNWVYHSGGATILEQVGDRQAYVYGVVEAPWPMRDRDTVVRFDYQQHPESKAITINITNFPEFIAAKEAFVRVPEFGGYWRLQPEKDGWVEVTYQVYGDPGGMIPVWLANHAAVTSVKHTLLNMESAVENYSTARLEFVEEFAD